MSLIHPTAIVSEKALVGEGTSIGAYSVIEDGVVIGKNCVVHNHALVRSFVTLGDQVSIHPFAVIGGTPQHMGFKNEPTTVVIGDRVTLRESVTVHRGTTFGTGVTRIDNDAYLMAYSHVAHDCYIGKHVILANSVQLAGHVEIQDYVTIGGQSAVAQFCRVGRYAYIGGGSIIRKDVPPFMVGKGYDLEIQGINSVGLQRRGFASDVIRKLKNLYKMFYLQNLTIAQATDKILTELGEADEVKAFLDFVSTSKVGFER